MTERLSVIVAFYNMRREAARTLFTLSPEYQRDVRRSDYRVICVDNGSRYPLDAHDVEAFGPNFEYHRIDNDSASPARAINDQVANCPSELVMVVIDGARMLTPGVLSLSLKAADAYPRPFAFTLGWHLGSELQNIAMTRGYDQQAEDLLLESIDWKQDGYQLFDISVLGGSYRGFLGGLPSESNCFVMRKSDYLSMGGYETSFESPGGGLVNLDFFKRAMQNPDLDPVQLLGEGSFHQFHGGVATNVPRAQHPFERFAEEYEILRGEPFRAVTDRKIHFLGSLTEGARRFLI
ncbi:MAG: hypothetical protein QNJ40_15175 [Xanthomonadales bacterium]|nr:hypothetical protein [Xanthomonadales bacterium]